jgi:hypothetical protein
LSSVHVEFRKSTAQRVAVHAKLFSGFALVAFVVREDFKDVATLKLPNGIRVENTGTMHLNHKTVQFALQRLLLACRLLCDVSSL